MAERLGSVKRLSLLDLPNELLINILYNFTTLPLLHFRSVCHQLQNLVLRIVHGRLLLAASLTDRKLILECYHPSAQYSEPSLSCEYLGTPGLSDRIAGRGSIFEDLDENGGRTLRKLYSRFRPVRQESQVKSRAPHPAGEVPGSRTSDAAEVSQRQQPKSEPVRRLIRLDAYENFSQLIFHTNLVQLGPRGVYLEIMTVNDKRTLRIFRNWLFQQAEGAKEGNPPETDSRDSPTDSSNPGENLNNIIWTDDAKKTAGLKLRVEECRWRRDAPILQRRDEEQAVSYFLELHELHVSTIHLLLAIERNILQKEHSSGQAVVFTTFRAAT